MERFKSQESHERYAELSQLVSYAIKLPPKELYQHSAELLASEEAGGYITLGGIASSIAHSGYIRDNAKTIEEGEAFLGPAINDIGRIADVIANKYPDLGDDELLRVMSETETINSVALLALRPEWNMGPYISDELPYTGRLNRAGAFIIEDVSLDFSDYLEESLGCPAAGELDRGAETGRVSPTGAFRKLVPWAAELHLIARAHKND